MTDRTGSITASLGLQPLSSLSHPREVVRQFTPNWFTATMGTGILALMLAQFPLAIPGLHALAEGLWVFNIGLFILFASLYGARWLFFFDEARRIFGHSTVSMFFGAIPMGLATIINGLLAFGVARVGTDTAVRTAEALWWVDVAMSLACGVAIPFMMFTRQRHSVDQMTAVWLLPVVAAEVAAVSGGLLAPHLQPDAAFGVLVTSHVLWASSVPVALSMLVILLLRMAVHKLPHASMAARLGWRSARSAPERSACWCWEVTRPPSSPDTIRPASVSSRKASAWSRACCCGATARGGWRWAC